MIQGLVDDTRGLPDGNYNYLIFDNKRNRPLPQLKYLFGVVLKSISDALPGHPPVDALYRYFEEAFAPIHSCIICGEKFEYFDLKSETSTEVDDVIQRIIHHAKTQLGIEIPDKESMKMPEAKELYTDAYAEIWKSAATKSSKQTQ